jgi:class 3 adenylate cyclase
VAPAEFKQVTVLFADVVLQEEATRVAVDVRERDGIDLRLRVGLNSGEVIAGSAMPPWVNRSAWLSGWSRWPRRVA